VNTHCSRTKSKEVGKISIVSIYVDDLIYTGNDKSMYDAATYHLAGGRCETHGCVFQGRKMHRVATNVYLRKT